MQSARTKIDVSIRDQRLTLTRDGEILRSYPVSSSRFGIGTEEGSMKTPLGRFRIAEKRIPSAPNRMSGQVAVRQHLRPCAVSADEPDSLGKWTGMRVARPLLRFGRPACVSQHLCPDNWNPVRESHSLGWFCRPLPGLFGQRDMKRRTEVITSVRDDCGFGVLNPIYLRICLARIFSLF